MLSFKTYFLYVIIETFGSQAPFREPSLSNFRLCFFFTHGQVRLILPLRKLPLPRFLLVDLFVLCYVFHPLFIYVHYSLQQDCPNGRLTPAKFVDMYKMFFPSGNAEEFCDHVFRTFDMDKNGYIDFKVSAQSTLYLYEDFLLLPKQLIYSFEETEFTV